MKHKVIKSSQIKETNFGFIKVKQLLNQATVPNMSLAIVKINGVNKKIVNRSSDALYYVLEGSGTFNISGEEAEVEKGDLVFIPKGSAYFDQGKMTLLAFNNPRFEADKIDYLD